MAQRKSLNRRLSRYSRLSVGSAILDPNTEILDEECPYWWQDLDNTTVRPSMGTDTLNQTSRYLYSDSNIETNTVEDRWWDVLESLNNSKTPITKATKDYSKEDTTDTASTSESEGEPRIVKKKCTLRSKAMNSQDNAFSDVLNNFETAILPEPVQESTRNSSMHSSVSVEKTLSNAEQLNNSQGSSRNHSLTTSIVKVRPRLFGKKYKDQNTNVFDDILNTDDLESSLKKQSSRISLTKELLTSTNDNPPATASTLVVNSTQHNHRTVSPENKNYCSASSSQSTVVNNNFAYTRDNNKDSTTSDAETTLLKPKSKFLNRHNKIANKTETNESTWKSIAAETETFKRPVASAADNPVEFLQPVSRNITSVDSSDSSNTSQRDDPPKKKSVFLNRSRESRKRNLFLDILQESDDSIIHETSRSKASVNHSRERNLVNENSKETSERQLVSDESSRNSMENVLLKYSGPLNVDNNDTINSSNKINSNVSTMLDPETATTSRNGNSEEEQSIDSAVSLIEQSKEKHTSQNNTNVNSGIHCNESSIRKSVSQNEREYVPEVDKSITDNTRTRSPAKIPNDSSQDDEYITKTQSGTWTRLENQKQRGTTDLESEKDVSTLKKRSKHFSSLQNKSASPITDENQQGQVQNGSGRESEGLDRSQKRSTSAIPNEEAQDKNDITKRQSRNISKSQNLSLRVVSSSDEEDIDVPKRQSKSLRRSQKRSTSAISNEEQLEDIHNTSKRQTGNSSKSQKFSLRVVSSSEEEEVDVPKRQSKSLGRSQKRSTSARPNEEELDDMHNTSKRQTRNSSKSQKLSLRVESSSDEEEIDVPKRQSKSLRRSQKRSTSARPNEEELDDMHNTSKRQTRNSSKSQKLSLRVVSSSDEEEVDVPKRQSKSLGRSQKQSTMAIPSEEEVVINNDIDNTPKRISWNPNTLKKLSVSITKIQDTRLHSSERQSGLNRVSELEALDNQTSSKKPTRKSSRIQKLLSSSTENEVEVERHEDMTNMQNRQSDSEAEIHTPSTRQRKKLSKSQKQSALGIAGEVEAEQSKDTTNMQSRKRGLEPEIQTPSKRQSKRFSRSQKQSALNIAEEVEAEQSKDTTMQSKESDFETEVETPSKRQSKRFSRSQKQSALNIAEEIESEHHKDTTNMQSRKSGLEPEIETPSKRQSKRSSRSQKQSALNIAEEIESEHHKDTNMQSRKSGLEPEIQTPSKRQSKRSSRSQKQSALNIAEEIEAEQSKDTTMQSRENDSETEVETPSKRQSKRFSRSHKLSALGIATEDVSEQDRDTASELRKESTVVDAGESNKNKSQDDVDVRYKTLNNLSKTLKQVNTTPKSTKRLTFNLNNPSDKENASASNATMNNERNSTQPCNIRLTNVLENTDKDAQTVGRRSIGIVSRSSRPNVSENRKTPNKATGSVAPSRMLINRIPTSSTSQRNIKDFFQVEKSLPASQVFADKQKLKEVKMKMEILKERVLAAMKPIQKNPEPKVLSRGLKPNSVAKTKKSTQTKEINKAFLVNGKVYKVPRLARPKPWITNRLYKFLWKKMDSKYGPNTRVVSEKFVRQLSEITTLIEKRKLYSKYESELLALMKEMARLNIIETRLDFYHFCQDFLPYELRFKMVPMLLPGNKRNIPYDPDKVYEPLLQD